jgi:DNA-directed RNA polymerase subunit alpha
MLIDDLDLGVRSLNCLKREGIETVGDLIGKSEQELMCIPNFGRKSLDEVRERLEKNNLKLRGE